MLESQIRTNTRTRIKICGITCIDDAMISIRAGADALGFVFYPPSSRAVEAGQVQTVIDQLPPFIAKVGLFLNPHETEVAHVLKTVKLDLLQFHGTESPEFCDSFSMPYLKTIGLDEARRQLEMAQKYQDASGFLFDSNIAGQPGGTGKTFDWAQLPRNMSKPVILAGGLNTSNVAEAIRLTRPYAVDVSSGVEASPGRKDPELVKQFVAQVICADSE